MYLRPSGAARQSLRMAGTNDGGFACWPLFQRDPCLKTLHDSPEFRGAITRLEREFGQVKIEYI